MTDSAKSMLLSSQNHREEAMLMILRPKDHPNARFYCNFWYKMEGMTKSAYCCDSLDAYRHEPRKAQINCGKILERMENNTYVKARANIAKAEPLYLIAIKGRTERQIYEIKGKLGKHIIPFFGAMKIKEITPDTVVAYKAMRELAGATKSTLDKEFCIIRDLIQTVHKGFKLPGKMPTFVNKPKKVSTALTIAEVNHIAQFVRQQSTRARNGKGPFGADYEKIFWIEAFTGMDCGDVLRLCPDSINWKKNKIEFDRGKSGIESSVQICARLRVILKSLRRTLDPSKPYFAGIGNSQANRAIQRAFKAAGFQGGNKALRHFVISQLTNSGLRIELIRKAVGHAPGSDITEDYIHLYDDTAEKAFTKAFDKE